MVISKSENRTDDILNILLLVVSWDNYKFLIQKYLHYFIKSRIK